MLINLRGVKAAGLFAEVTTYTQARALRRHRAGRIVLRSPREPVEFNPSGESLLDSVAALAPLTMFAYLGLESATVPAGDVRDPQRTIPRSTIIGISVAALLYVLGTVVVFGVVPRQELVNSVAPFSDAARLMWGSWGAGAIAIAIILSSIGALNGWTLMMGQVPMAAAQDGVFPPAFGRLSKRGVPSIGIVVSAAFTTAMVAIQAAGSPGVRAFYNPVVSLSTMAAVIPYAFCALAVGLVAARTSGSGGKVPRVTVVEGIAFVFSVFTVYGCGPTAVLYGLILLLLGIPVYVWQRHRAPST